MSALVDADREFSTDEVCRLTGATYRQVNYWCSIVRHLDRPLSQPGSGARRRFTRHDLELVDAIRQLSDIGCLRTGPLTTSGSLREQAFHAALDVVRDRPVVAGEWLIVTLDPPRARRMVSPSLAQSTALWAVPLRTAEDLTS